jgi:hypothetical protein
MPIKEVRALLAVCLQSAIRTRESAYVRLAHPLGDLHRLGSHCCGVAWNNGAYLPFALNPVAVAAPAHGERDKLSTRGRAFQCD